ncbi:phosphatidate cytidylyltransferase [Aerococcus mictus]|uniref:phosphatidate cytidylyltransferase n=1 Tax=Aerococcus mictus TaxID=2976810 RepID=UPI0022791FB0|nr:phosphatidate cytidylyltransferase [Aerococcus mictus]MCY3085547.1 phosphatidate cytidylyltransferase [Aerococcus mictus]
MKTRTITAIIALVIFIPFLLIGGGYFEALVVLLGIVSLSELLKMMNVPLFSFEGLVTQLMMLVVLLPDRVLSFVPHSLTVMDLFYAGIIFLFIAMVYFPEQMDFKRLCALAVSAVYVGIGYHYMIMTRRLGLFAVIFAFGIIWFNDSFAYLAGVHFGRHKLAPKISPNKTIEGSIGGILAGIIYSLCLNFFDGSLNLPLLSEVILAIALCLLGQFGDLIESAIKRYFKVKDSGKILPGHGGLLDRFDSLLIVLPMFHYLVAFL